MNGIKNFDFTDQRPDEDGATAEMQPDAEESLIDGWEAYEEWLRVMRDEQDGDTQA